MNQITIKISLKHVTNIFCIRKDYKIYFYLKFIYNLFILNLFL